MEVINYFKSYQKLGWMALTLVFCGIVSLPILQAGFFSDDITNSVIPGTIALYKQGFWGCVVLGMQHWLSTGRIFPFSAVSTVTVFYFFPAVNDYQILRSLFIWASIISFAWFIKVVAKNYAAALLFIFLIPLFWSVRTAPDPLTSFAIFLPLLVIFTAWTLIFYRYYQVSQQQKFLILSLTLYTCALCTYEIGILAFFLVLTLMHFKSINNHSLIKEGKPYFILLMAYLIITVVMHTLANNSYDGIQIQLSAHFWPTFFAQLTAGLPLSYFLFANHPALPINVVLSDYHNLLALSYLLVVGTACIYWLLDQLVLTKRSCVCFSVMALSLTVVPAFIMGINQKYQLILHMGIGYIPVYLQYLGMGLLLLAVFGALNLLQLSVRSKRKIHWSLAFLLSVVITVTTALNLATVKLINEKYKFNRVLVEQAARHGFLHNLPEGSYLIEKQTLWNTPDFYKLNADKQLADVIDVRDMHKLQEYGPSNNTLQKHKYFLSSFHLPGSQYGYVLLGRAKWAAVKNYNNINLTTAIFMTDPTLFISANSPSQRTEILQNLQQQLNLSAASLKEIVALAARNPQVLLITALPVGNYRIPI
jgi:hypothetical protein